MSESKLPQIWLARHGETAWSLSGQHTGRTDLPLTSRGEQNADLLGKRLRAHQFAMIFTSPLQRARRTCEIAGLAGQATVDPDLVEWDYGEYEGLTTKQIRERNPKWDLFRDGCPSGESVDQISARADRVVAKLRAVNGDTLVFSSGHILRVIASRWLGVPASTGRYLALDTATLSILGSLHRPEDPVIRLWNDGSHLRSQGE
jgi:broad specificity phosphatase PhoE